ncbi:MAG: hypothetical protein RLY35_1398 [Bacteroidota bacterium]
MKNILSICFAVFAPIFMTAQSFSPKAIVSAGNAVTVNGTYISWSVGETFVSTLSGGNVVLTQGFQQPEVDNDVDNDGFTVDVDCDDNNPDVNPAAIEICDALDNNCDGALNENLATTYYADVDGDGYAGFLVTLDTCQMPVGYNQEPTDCDDGNISVNPGALEQCNSIDDNCNGTVDEGQGFVFFTDADGDGYGDTGSVVEACQLSPGLSETAGDCDDNAPAVNPGAQEICDNGIDDNCDGVQTSCNVSGCTDNAACNFDPLANLSDGSCIYPTQVYLDCNGACLNDTDGDGICNELEVAGCMDVNACNYNDLATDSDASCTYPTQVYLDCNGVCLNDTDGDGVCNELEVAGCTDVDACNYDPEATNSDNSCTYPTNSFLDCFGTCINDTDQDGVCDELEIAGCTDLTACNYNPAATNSDNSCTYPENVYVDCQGVCNNDTDGDGVCDELEIPGCTDPSACNYNELATNDDGSCSAPGVEICNGADDNCNGQIDEGLTPGSITSIPVNTNVYPVCIAGNMFSANLNNGTDSPVIDGNGPDLWYSLTAQHNALRVGLSAATGDNTIQLYRNNNGCLELIVSENEATTGNQTLIYDQLVVGQSYYVALHRNNGVSNTSAKICFHHFVESTCDHYYSNGTGVYTSVCNSYKVAYRANASSYNINVLSAAQNGVDLNYPSYSFTTPNSGTVIARLGTLLAPNNTGSAINYTMNVGVVYSLPDAAGNFSPIIAEPTSSCGLTLNSELSTSLRLADRCPTLKAINQPISMSRAICGALYYQWEFAQVSPSAAPAVYANTSNYASVLFLNNVPGIGPGKTYNVRVRAVHASGNTGEWGATECLKTAGTGMALLSENNQTADMVDFGSNSVAIYPNPVMNGTFTIIGQDAIESEAKVEIFNNLGARVWSSTYFSEGSKLIEVPVANEWASGLYMVNVKWNGKEMTKRLVIEK